MKTVSKKRKLRKLESELEAEADKSEPENDFTEEELEKARERLNEGLEAGEEWAEDFLEISEKLEKVEGEPFENMDKLTKGERERLLRASRHVYIW